MKKILITLVLALLPTSVFAYTGTWGFKSTTTPNYYPNSVFGNMPSVWADHFVATSTIATSSFPIASTSNLYVSTIPNMNVLFASTSGKIISTGNFIYNTRNDNLALTGSASSEFLLTLLNANNSNLATVYQQFGVTNGIGQTKYSLFTGDGTGKFTISTGATTPTATGTPALTITATQLVGIGSTTPVTALGVTGTTTTTNFRLTGAFADSLNLPGTNGMVLQTTGSAVKWVATSTLGISGGGGTPASPSGSIQYNDSGSFGGSSNATLNSTGDITAVSLNLNSQTIFNSDGSGLLLGGNVTLDPAPPYTIGLGAYMGGGEYPVTLRGDGEIHWGNGTGYLNSDGSANFANSNFVISTDGSLSINAGLATIDTFGNISGSSFIKNGGTSSQFLKANGSVDSTTYLSGTIPVSNGGTGSTSWTTNYVLLGNGTSAFKQVATSSLGLTPTTTTATSTGPTAGIGNIATATSTCSDGKHVFGGGASISGNANDAELQQSYPALSSTAWVVTYQATLGVGAAGTISVYAQCY